MNSRCSLFQLPIITACLLLLLAQQAMAKPLYLEQLEKATVTDKVLQKARQQIKDHKDIKILDKLAVAPFHLRRTQPIETKQPFCLGCHLPLPHRDNERSRSFMNMHSRYIACETCHLRPKAISLEYRWLAFSGPNAGRTVPPNKLTVTLQKSPADNTQKNKHRVKKKKHTLVPQAGARITPFYNDEPVLIFKDHHFSRQTRKQWKKADTDEQARLKVRLHTPLEKEGPACKACHSKDKPMLDLKALGATAKQLSRFQHNTISRFFARFKESDERIRIGDLLK